MHYLQEMKYVTSHDKKLAMTLWNSTVGMGKIRVALKSDTKCADQALIDYTAVKRIFDTDKNDS